MQKLLIAMTAVLSVFAQAKDTVESQVLSKLHHGNLLEVEMSRLVESRAVSQEAKDLAEMLIRDHSQADQKVQQVAQSRQIVLRDIPRTAEELTIMQQVQARGGLDLDRYFARVNVDRHAATLSFLRNIRPQISDEAVLALVDELLPTLQSHYEHAIQVRDRLMQEQGWIPPTTFKMRWTCDDAPICTMEAGPYGTATAQIGHFRFRAVDPSRNSTCCQLSGKIWRKICQRRLEPKNVQVVCR